MKFIVDFFPVLFFFIAYKLDGFYTATAVLMISTFIQTVGSRLVYGRFEKVHLITLALVLLFGGATLLFHNEMFLKWKPTAINWLFAAAFIGSQFIGDKNLTERLMGAQMALPAFVWSRLNSAWALFFIGMGALNLHVAYQYDEATWVDFKMFGIMGLTVLFIIAQGIYLARHLPKEADEAEQ